MCAWCRRSQSVSPCLQVDSEELYFLLLHFLADGPCQEAAASLQQEALKYQLLPTRTDFRGAGCELTHGNATLDMHTPQFLLAMTWRENLPQAMTDPCQSAGERHALTYSQLKDRFSHVAPAQLQAILREALLSKQAESNPGQSSLLHRGTACNFLYGRPSYLAFPPHQQKHEAHGRDHIHR